MPLYSLPFEITNQIITYLDRRDYISLKSIFKKHPLLRNRFDYPELYLPTGRLTITALVIHYQKPNSKLIILAFNGSTNNISTVFDGSAVFASIPMGDPIPGRWFRLSIGGTGTEMMISRTTPSGVLYVWRGPPSHIVNSPLADTVYEALAKYGSLDAKVIVVSGFMYRRIEIRWTASMRMCA